MGLEKHCAKHQFGLKDLGVLDGPPLRGAGTIVKMVDAVFGVPRAAFLVFDDNSGSVFVRMTSSAVRPKGTMPSEMSIASMVRSENKTIAIDSTREEAPDSIERRLLGAGALLGSPVHGPDKLAVGVLAAMHHEARAWTSAECRKIEDLAHLISQEIMLRASFETLRIMSAERHWPSA